MSDNFIKESKSLHISKEKKGYWKGAFDANYADTARHHSMLALSLPIVKGYSGESVLSIGDNRGRDANYYKQKLSVHAVASDLSADHLQPAVDDGHLDAVYSLDVENIALPDNSVDFVVAKETFHHWPRPMLGLYECLRVCSKGLLLFEPNDCLKGDFSSYPQQSTWHDSYEVVGNYKYQISLREVHKVAWSLRLPVVIAHGFNDPYQADLDIDEYYTKRDHLDKLGYENKRQFNLMFIAILKSVDEATLEQLDETYNVAFRPLNPYE